MILLTPPPEVEETFDLRWVGALGWRRHETRQPLVEEAFGLRWEGTLRWRRHETR